MADEEAVENEDEQATDAGADSETGKAEQREESDPPAGETDDDDDGGGDEEQSEESQKAQEKEQEREAAREKMDEIEEDPPADLEDWPDDAAKYETFGGAEGEHSYDEGPESKLGPSSLRHLEGGGVTIEGEEVDDPDEYKGKPIPGGPTDEEASQDLTAERIREEQGRGGEGGGSDGDEDGDGDSGDSGDSESGDDGEGDSDSDSDDSSEDDS